MKNLFNFLIYLIIPLISFTGNKNIKLESDNLLGHLYIPKISVSNDLYKYGNDINNVDINVYVATLYDFNKLDGSLILASHSGNCSICFFNNLYKLSNGDEIIIENSNNIYLYVVDDMFEIDKTGKFKYNDKDKYIYLVTCVKNTHKKQLIVGGFLKKITKKSTLL